jgi:hypothetical protein
MSGLTTGRRFADVVVVLLRQHIVAVMRPIVFAAAQFNIALHDGSLTPIPCGSEERSRSERHFTQDASVS